MSIATLLMIACASTQPVPASESPQSGIAKDVQPRQNKPITDVTKMGAPVAAGDWFKIQGYNSVWIREQRPHILITLNKTAWDEIDGAREGRATLSILDVGNGTAPERTKKIVIIEGQARMVFGVEMELKTAFEVYLDGRYEPMVELRLRGMESN